MKDLAAIQKPHFQQVTHVYDHAIHAGLVSSQMTSWVAQLLAKKIAAGRGLSPCMYTELLPKKTNQLISNTILTYHEFHDQTQNFRKKQVLKKKVLVLEA